MHRIKLLRYYLNILRLKFKRFLYYNDCYVLFVIESSNFSKIDKKVNIKFLDSEGSTTRISKLPAHFLRLNRS
jgi:hypothetical protein